jgi:carboxymethylenebutenolidase
VLSGAAVSHDDLVLTSADGTEFAAFSARPDGPIGACVVVLPDVRGLYRFYEELALRFAERGYAAIAIDYFGRTAGVAKRGDDFEYMPHVGETKPELVQADVAAAIEHLRVLGPAERASEIEAPILALQAGDDQNITKERNDAFETALTEAGIDHEIVVYEGAPHSFFDRKQEDFATASEDAWTRTLSFIERLT